MKLPELLTSDEFSASWGERPAVLTTESRFISLTLLEHWLQTPVAYQASLVRLSRASDINDANRKQQRYAGSFTETVREFRSGRAVTVNRLERLAPPDSELAKLYRWLSTDLCYGDDGVQFSAFLAPAGTRAFGRHSDRNHVLSLQVQGEKHWTVGDSEHLLAPGEVLYIPYGVDHAATAGHAAPSLSMSIILRPPTWREVLAEALFQFCDDCEARQLRTPRALPFSWAKNPPVPPRSFSRLALNQVASPGSISRALARVSVERLSTLQPRALTLSDPADELAQDTMATARFVRLEQSIVTHLGPTQALIAGSKSGVVAFPSGAGPAIRFLEAQSGPFKLQDLADICGEKSARELLRSWVSNGLIRPVEE